jgi:hypothetical protein
MPDTTQLTPPERAAWRVALRLSLPITAADIRELLAAAHAAEYSEWTAAGRPGAVSHGEALAQLLTPSPAGPFDTEREARAAAHAAIPPAAGNSILTAEQNHQLLSRALDAAGVRTGRYDDRITGWLAQWEDATVAAIAGWVQRAAALPGPGGQAAAVDGEPMHDALTTERAHRAWLAHQETQS